MGTGNEEDSVPTGGGGVMAASSSTVNGNATGNITRTPEEQVGLGGVGDDSIAERASQEDAAANTTATKKQDIQHYPTKVAVGEPVTTTKLSPKLVQEETCAMKERVVEQNAASMSVQQQQQQQALDPTGIMPLPARPPPQAPSLPGAHPMQTRSNSILHSIGARQNDNANDAPWDLTGRPDNNREGLAVANLVPDDDERLPTAWPHAGSTPNTEQKRSREARKLKTHVLIGAILVVALIMILVAILSPGGGHGAAGNSSQDDPTTNASTNQTQAPTIVTDYVLSLLPEDTMDKILADPDSPQALAFDWLMEEDDDEGGSSLMLSEDRILQKFALATLYYSTNGGSWGDNTYWLNHSIHECHWYTRPDFALVESVVKLYPGYLKGFFPLHEPPLNKCDNNGLYQHFWLDANGLSGSLPDEFFLLTNLRTLSVGYNGMEGTISTHVGQLTRLEGLHLSDIANAGTVPSEIGLLNELRYISMTNNNHHGTLPNEFWQLTNMDTASLRRNPELQGTISPRIGEFQKMRWFVMEACDLSGTLPTEIGMATSLEWLVLFENGLIGTIPTELQQLSHLQILSLYVNSLHGSIPSEVGKLSSLYIVSVRDNLLSSTLPSQLGLLTNLQISINLRNNLLSGTIPTELGSFPNLVEMEFQGNHFSGPIPSELGQLTSLGQLTFANNSLSGTVPEELTALQPTLHTLRLEGNPGLSGTLPAGICDINATCLGNAFDQCQGPYGLSFDCSDLLCGCGCPCQVS